jgi:hypothetical protein
MLPAFNSDGNLPEGIHHAAEEAVFARFATASARRQWLGEQLRSLLALAKATGQLSRVFLWGSFVTSKEVPNDVDVLLVMAADFAVEALPAHQQVYLTMSRRASVSMPMSFGRRHPWTQWCWICGWTRTKRAKISRGEALWRWSFHD